MTLPSTSQIPYLPERIQGLGQVAMNLSWRWDRWAWSLFRELDPPLWRATRHNPIDLLRQVGPARLAACANDPGYLERYDRLMARRARAAESGTWFSEHHPDLGDRPVAYFCAEFGVHNSVPIYSGGLGVLAGDHCKAASDLGVPLVAIGLMYSKGYFDQKIRLDGWQEDSNEIFNPLLTPLQRLYSEDGDIPLATVEVAGNRVHVGCWRMDVGRVPIFLLDTNLVDNAEEDRGLTSQLYGSGVELRLKQEWILGVGGVRVLRALGIDPGAWHANEGHAAFMLMERLRELHDQEVALDQAIREVRARSVFTTHTPVPAGHDSFSRELIDGVLGHYWEDLGFDRQAFLDLGRHPEIDHETFHMTAAAIRLSRWVNGVSRVHGKVTRRIWRSLWPEHGIDDVPIGDVTNGVHLTSWMSHGIMELLDEGLGEGWEEHLLEPELWDRVPDLDDGKLWDMHMVQKSKLLSFIREEARQRWRDRWGEAVHLVGAGTLLSPEPLTIGFARRFATYKRADLLFLFPQRLRRLLTDPQRPVQVIFAGKAHPADEPAKQILQKVYSYTRDGTFEGRIAFLEDYELHVAHRLVQGVDLWLNLPRVPFEASGTSGMKAGLNGVLQLGTLDGWWAEGFNGENGWALPLVGEDVEDADADLADHDALFELLEREIVPLYYDRDADGLPRGWIARMKQAVRVAGSAFTTRRMVRDYVERYYVKALRGSPGADDLPAR